MPQILLAIIAPDWLIYAPATIAGLGILVFVHEFGHYFVAKLCGVRVEVFSLGFGKRLWGFRRGETDYRVSLLPVGGYVKMAGENPMEARTGDPGEFMSHPRWQRFLIAIAGPAMNILLAVAIWTGLFMAHFPTATFLSQPTDIGSVKPGSPGEKAGLIVGDRVVRIENISNPTWEQFENKVLINAGQPLGLTVQRGSQTLSATLIPQASGKDQAGDAGVYPVNPVLAGRVDPGPAATAGMKDGDQIVSINTTIIHNFDNLVDTLQQVKNTPAEITVLRNGSEIHLTVTPVFGEVSTSGDKKWKIGIAPEQHMTITHLPPGPAMVHAVAECRKWSSLVFELVGNLVHFKVSIRTMSGPLGIVRMSEQAASQGPVQYFFLMALISLQLAIFNMLPIPILDGGLMLMLLIEGLMRRDIRQEIKERVYQLAFVFLLLFAAVVIFNDVAKSL